MRPPSKSRYHWRGTDKVMKQCWCPASAVFIYLQGPMQQQKSLRLRLKFLVFHSACKTSRIYSMFCQTWSLNWSTMAVASPELSFCDWDGNCNCSATVYYRTQRQTRIWKTSPTETLNRRHPKRTFAAEKSLPVAYKLIELCSLSLSLRRNVITTWCVKHWENSPPTRVQAASFWQNVRSQMKLEWKDKCSYTFREYKTRNSKTVGK